MAAGRFQSLGMIAVFDVGGPLLVYQLLRSAGVSTVSSLILSGIPAALGVLLRAVLHRRLDAIGVLVLAGIVVGSVLGVVTHSARLVLVEGSVPTGVFGLACFASLAARRPLMYLFSLEFIGPETERGREMTALWHYDEFRRVFRVITFVWGFAFLAEAALRVFIVYNFSAGTALSISKVTPFVFTGVMFAWTFGYGTYHRKKGERESGMTASELVAQAIAGTADGDDHEPGGEHQAGAQQPA